MHVSLRKLWRIVKDRGPGVQSAQASFATESGLTNHLSKHTFQIGAQSEGCVSCQRLPAKGGPPGLFHCTRSLRMLGVFCFIISRKGVKTAECETNPEPRSLGLGLSSTHPLPVMLCRVLPLHSCLGSACCVLDLVFCSLEAHWARNWYQR